MALSVRVYMEQPHITLTSVERDYLEALVCKGSLPTKHEMWFSPIGFYATLDKYSALNLPVHITEFIPQSSGKDIIGWRKGKWTEQSQADFAEQFYTLAFGHPTVASINWWAFSDKNAWLKGGGLVGK